MNNTCRALVVILVIGLTTVACDRIPFYAPSPAATEAPEPVSEPAPGPTLRPSPEPTINANTVARKADLEKYRALWGAERPDAYTFEYQVDCFCPPETLAQVRITVEGTRVTRVEFTQPTPVGGEEWGSSSGQDYPANKPFPAALLGDYPTIDSLLEKLEEDINSEPDLMWVGYDESYGYPLEASIDLWFEVADDEWSYRITNFRLGSLPQDGLITDP